MNRYFACLLFESHVSDGRDDPRLTDESIRLVIADDEIAAREKAEAFGKESEHEYLNEDGARVAWRLVCVVDVQEFCDEAIDDGVEVYSRLNWQQSTDL